MTTVTSYTPAELVARRELILAKHGMSLSEFADKASQYALVGDEWQAWEDLESIEFLLTDC
ncbi:hypothetical protein RhoFasB10_00922 [Rhodococcus sp. B10]|uniref:Uncharacterized protein n=1 Tax=Rhodococcoides kyotonense TaxID=398843 RepID=A0A177YGZ0_9NOCA|nr:hypothetical protein [Rhodococcus kyotonensis]NIL74830.1 hypothetical protein [Rhodococcus sp. B10]OAK54826.1 hypothetical protein A3K89_05790 [Rhodococcus kyotonensis]